MNAPNADWVYVRFLPNKAQVEAAKRRKKHIFIAGATVSGRRVRNWQQADRVGIDAILTDFPLDLQSQLRLQAGSRGP